MIDKYKNVKEFLDRNSNKYADDFTNASEYFMFCNMKQMYEDIEQLQQQCKKRKEVIDKIFNYLEDKYGYNLIKGTINDTDVTELYEILNEVSE